MERVRAIGGVLVVSAKNNRFAMAVIRALDWSRRNITLRNRPPFIFAVVRTRRDRRSVTGLIPNCEANWQFDAIVDPGGSGWIGHCLSGLRQG